MDRLSLRFQLNQTHGYGEVVTTASSLGRQIMNLISDRTALIHTENAFKVGPYIAALEEAGHKVVKCQMNAADLCSMYDFTYSNASNENELITRLSGFFKPSEKPALLEIFTPSDINDLILKDYFKNLR